MDNLVETPRPADPTGQSDLLGAHDASRLSIPDLDPDLDTAGAALEYAGCGWYVVPILPETKHAGSVLGKGWPAWSSRDPQEIISWFAGRNLALALHVGRSGAIVFDVDRPDLVPEVMAQNIDTAPFQATRTRDLGRGHYVFLQPQGRMIGNSVGQLGGAWGEVRGRNGIIVVGPSTHSKATEGGCYHWLRVGAVPLLPDELAELLPDSVNPEAAVTDAEVEVFLKEHQGNRAPRLFEAVRAWFAKVVEAGESRHESAVKAAAWALREARAGYYSASVATNELREMFFGAMQVRRPRCPDDRVLSPGQADHEWNGILAWVVPQVTAEDMNKIREKIEEALAGAMGSFEDLLTNATISTEAPVTATNTMGVGHGGQDVDVDEEVPDERSAGSEDDAHSGSKSSTRGSATQEGTEVDTEAVQTTREATGEAGGSAESKEKQSQATLLLKMALERFQCGISTDGEPFARPRGGGGLVRMFKGGKDSLKAELSALYAKRCHTVPSASALTDALQALEGLARESEPIPLHLRVAEHDGATILDLGRPDGQVVVIEPSGWRVTPDSPVLFRRTALTLPLPIPEAGGNLDEIRKLLNVTDEAWPLVVAWLVMALFATIAHPVLMFHSEHGTGKTTAAKTMSRVVDPAAAQVRAAPRDVRNWGVAATGSWVVAVDNVSAIQPWFSDALCRAVTGEGIVDRALYTDFDVAVRYFRRCVMLTSIDAGALQGDLADRLMPIELERIAPGARLEERELDAAFEEMHPRVLGALLDMVSEVKAGLPDIHLDELPRMADAARIMAAIDAVRGTTCLATYLDVTATLTADVLDGDLVAETLCRIFEERVDADGRWVTTSQEVLAQINSNFPALLDRPSNWPDSPTAMSGWLARSAPALRLRGIEYTKGRRTSKQRPVIFTRSSR